MSEGAIVAQAPPWLERVLPAKRPLRVLQMGELPLRVPAHHRECFVLADLLFRFT
jgi:hypothetical protein